MAEGSFEAAGDYTVVVHADRSKQRKMVGLGILVTSVLGFVGIVIGLNEDNLVALVVGLAGVVFFGVSTLVFAWELLHWSDQPPLVIDRRGFHCRGFGGFGFVSWEEVDELGTWSMHSAKGVIGRVQNPAGLDAARSPIARWVARRNRRWCDFWISDSTLEMDADQIVGLMTTYLADAGPRPDDE